MSNEPIPTIREVDGKIVLIDPVALAIVRATAKSNCRHTLRMNAERVSHFKNRMRERGDSPSDVVIMLVNANDKHGGPLADILVPGCDWQAIRDRGEVPFARGLAGREGIQEMLDVLDKEAGDKLREMKEVALVIVDHGVAEIFVA